MRGEDDAVAPGPIDHSEGELHRVRERLLAEDAAHPTISQPVEERSMRRTPRCDHAHARTPLHNAIETFEVRSDACLGELQRRLLPHSRPPIHDGQRKAALVEDLAEPPADRPVSQYDGPRRGL